MEKFFEVDGKKYVGDLSNCDCGELCGVNIMNVTSHDSGITFIKLAQFPSEFDFREDESECCQVCK